MPDKNINDIKKENHEEAILENAIRLSRKKKKLTRDILSLLDGETIYRDKNDRPDIVRAKEVNGRKVFVGVEHFLVEQVSVNKKGSRVSVIKEKRSYAEKIIDNKETYLNDPDGVKKAKIEIANIVFDIASQTNKSGIKELKESFDVAWKRHLSNAEDYRENVIHLADGNPIKLAYLIEVRSNADDVFLNNGRTAIRRKNSIYPVFTWMIEELEKANPESMDYIILYLTNPIHTEIEDVIAVEVKDIRGSLRKQGIIAYEYCDDPSVIDINKYDITERSLKYTLEVKNKDSFGMDMIPILQQAYKYKTKSIPYVVSCSIQSMMYAFGRARFIGNSSEIKVISEFPQEIALLRYAQFITKYPNKG